MWGGTTERERRALLRRFPDVASWRELIEADPELVAWPGAYRVARTRRALEHESAVR